MMLRILNKHPQLMVLNELHFFEQLWDPQEKNKILEINKAVELASKLLLTQRVGYMTHDQNYKKFYNEASDLINTIPKIKLTSENIFHAFIHQEVILNGKSIICEKTPQNVFYLKEIFELYPNARVINMVRDPRAILLSQKNKWNRRNLGGSYMTLKEAFRLRVNYHPITLSNLWNAAIRAALQFKEDNRVYTVRFEDLLESPENTIRNICHHIGVTFDTNMMNITQESSSNEKDSTEIGFKKERASNWKLGGLNTTEQWICQQQCRQYMTYYNYTLDSIRPNIALLCFYYISFPVKIAFALLLNLNRMKNVIGTLKRRLQ